MTPHVPNQEGRRAADPLAADPWDPARYERFATERNAPFYDLLALVRPVPGGRAVDLGCGTGTLTAALHRHVRARETLGLDSSAAMLERARPLAGGGLHFVQGDIAAFGAPAPGKPGGEGRWDLVFSNAALHWVPDHPGLLGRLQVYGHHLAGPEQVIEWTRGTMLTDYQRRMPPELFEELLVRYRERLLPRLDQRRPYFYPFKRILLRSAGPADRAAPWS